MLSVIMPALNARGTIETAARTTLRAMRDGDELIVLDDGSTDDTAARVSAIQDRRIRILRNSMTVGVSRGLNQLVSECRGEYIARMDADDVCFPWRFSAQIRRLELGIDLSFTTRVNFGKRLKFWRPGAISPVSDADFADRLLESNFVPHSSLTAKASALKAEPGPYRETPAEDYDLWLRLAARGFRMERLALPGIAYRLHSQQVTRNQAWIAGLQTDGLLADSLARLRATVARRP